ncbi:acetyl-CoA carboxylase biotin carboxyl carrier protein subunit [Solitalea longa]|uniref:Acetyl-CoA carboxylase biotin carboxyl carrier protein subunit n=1 Tax=Solitalea longa TaxID=2079460 RepID=A0A2S5A3E1_9SPHI|nr:acetyl-CoA carboxylase biotin carboxyl carrier protein subunit [Solitalea longa]POY37065.1 acetyl-CoA carboxylase biotin carboxyl carrier protein subunit [Solitalea longa]
MYKATVNKKETFSVSTTKDTVLVKDKALNVDIKEISNDNYHILNADGKSFNAEVLEHNVELKTATVLINGNKYNIELKDKFDELLHSLGMDAGSAHKMNDLKAPMPGLVLKVLVNEGDEVKKDDALLVLEAMKMENIIKASADGIIKTIKIKERETVEKNQILIAFK